MFNYPTLRRDICHVSNIVISFWDSGKWRLCMFGLVQIVRT
jgi:hypothetical protein